MLELHPLFRRAVRALSDLSAARALRGVRRRGRVQLVGAPHVEALGTIELGEDVIVVSEPVQSHFVAARGARISIGARAVIGSGAAIAAHASVEIGEGAELAPGVVIMDTDFHATNDISGASTAEPVSIGAGARIGERVTILKGSRIGRNARIAADSVVAGDIPDDAEAFGVPARVVQAGGAAPITDLGDLGEAIAAIVARTFRAPHVAQDDGPTTIRGWDSLGALRLLVAIEDAYRIVLPENALARSPDVRSLAAVVAERIASGRE